jgi:hypothetical protein
MAADTFIEVDELLGMTFGELGPDKANVIARFHIRTLIAGHPSQVDLDPIGVDYQILSQFRESLPSVLEAMEANGAHAIRLALPETPLPAWDHGPRLKSRSDGRQVPLCTNLRFLGMLPELGAALVSVELRDRTFTSLIHAGSYAVSYLTVMELSQNIAKMLRRMEKAGYDRRYR